MHDYCCDLCSSAVFSNPTRWLTILRLKCTKFNFGWDSAPDPARGAYSAPPDLLAGLRGLLLREGKRRDGKGEGKGQEGRGDGMGEGKGRGRGGDGKGEGRKRDTIPSRPPQSIFLDTPLRTIRAFYKSLTRSAIGLKLKGSMHACNPKTTALNEGSLHNTP